MSNYDYEDDDFDTDNGNDLVKQIVLDVTVLRVKQRVWPAGA